MYAFPFFVFSSSLTLTSIAYYVFAINLSYLPPQITQQHLDDTERMESLNRALYGQALADQERAALSKRRTVQSAAANAGTGTGSGGEAEGENAGTAGSPSKSHGFGARQVRYFCFLLVFLIGSFLFVVCSCLLIFCV